MIDLRALETAFARIGSIGREEETFLVDEIPVTVRALSDEENVQTWKYAAVAIEDSDDAASQQEWMHRLKIATLSYAIVQVGDQDLRESLVNTGEVLSNGNSVTREKTEVVRQLLSGMNSVLLLRLFARFGEFVSRVEKKAEAAIEYEPLDFDAEIKEAEERLAELQQLRENQQKSKESVANQVVKETHARNEKMLQQRQQQIASLQAAKVQQAAKEQESLKIVPTERSPIREVMLPKAPAYTQEQVWRATQATQEEQASQEGVDEDSSFIDPNDPETMQQVQNQQVLLMQQKQRQQRQNAIEEQRRQEISAIPVRSGRVPPHMQAAKAQEAVQLGTTSAADGTEMPVYQMPTQTLSGRGGTPNKSAPDLNPKPQGKVNPHFKPAR